MDLRHHLQTPPRSQMRELGTALTIIPRVLQMPSLDALDALVEETYERAGTVRGVSATTLRWARNSYRRFRTFMVDRRKERAFLSGDVEEQRRILEAWVAWMRSRGLSAVTINTTWRATGHVFRWIEHERGVVTAFTFVRPPRYTPAPPAFLGRDAVLTLLERTESLRVETDFERRRNLATVGLMLFSGLRRCEVVRLMLADVDTAGGTMRIRGAKGMHGGRDRVAFIPPQLAGILDQYIEARSAEKRTHPELVSSARADRAVSFGAIAHLFHRLSQACQFRVTPHMCRHSCAMLLRQDGADVRTIMEWLGHRSLIMAQRYAHVEGAEMRAAAVRFRLKRGELISPWLPRGLSR